MKFSDNLKAARLSRNLTQEALANRIGVSTVALQNWERGTRKPSFEALLSLSEQLGIRVDRLMGAAVSSDPAPLDRKEAELIRNYRQLDSFGRAVVSSVCRIELQRTSDQKITVVPSRLTRQIRRYFFPAAAGFAAPVDGEDFEWIRVDDSVPADADFAVNIRGNSMSPFIEDGDTVYVKRCETIEPGECGIFCVDGSIYCKIYDVTESGDLRLLSANPACEKSNVFVQADSGESVKLLGVVLIDRKPGIPEYASAQL